MSLWILARANNKKGVSNNGFNFDCLYQIHSRGVCSICKDHVWTDQKRRKSGNNYFHYECPNRVKRSYVELKKISNLLKDRRYSWEKVCNNNEDILCIED
jgi:hypothetical protein